MMKVSIKFADDVNRSDVGKRRNNRRLTACPDGAYSAELVRSVQRAKAMAPAKDEKTTVKIIEGGKK